MALVEKSESNEIIDHTGKTVIVTSSKEFDGFNKNGIAIFSSPKFGLFDKRGKTILQPIYDSIRLDDDGYFLVIHNKKYGR